jgi:SAM-dependent methyltransferase
LTSEDLRFDLSCRFTLGANKVGPIAIVDISPTGAALEPTSRIDLPPGCLVDELRIDYHGSCIWEGHAKAIYNVEGPPARAGLQFTSHLFDLQLLYLSDNVIETLLTACLEQDRRAVETLPADWRAAVARVRQMLLSARDVLHQSEALLSKDPDARSREERALIERIFEKWKGPFHDQLSELHAQSRAFNEEVAKVARGYAGREILSLVYPCPIHSRAFEKPLGYAGDYKLMLLLMADVLEGDGIFGRFLHYLTQNYTLGRAVRSREKTMRSAARQAVASSDRPIRIMSLACGPAVELQRLIRESGPIDQPVEFILIDQDEETMRYCHEKLSRALLSRPRGSEALTLKCLHLSVLQVLRPQGEKEREFVSSNLNNIDLIYSAGLYDYLPQPLAARLTRRLYSMLAPGGRLFIGNLRDCADSSWMMEYVSAWILGYREPEQMLRLATGLKPQPSSSEVVYDETGYCMFLKLERSTET